VFSTRKGLESQYGPQTAEAIITEMKNLVQLASKTPSWSALLFLADDQSITSPLGVKPAVAGDPWKLKLALTDLDAALAKKGEMIGAVLIVGGPQVVPFHRLPNPTDDGDADVSSDNPYASLDENYFIPNWPIGRLPAPTGNDAGMLLAALRRIETNRSRQTQPISWWRRNPVLSKTIKAIRAKLPHGLAMRPSFGYSASVWKQSSLAVFNVIGDTKSMLVCPPAQATDLPASNLLPATLSYFNLHGLSDGPDWYGQRDAGDTSGAPDYPVAVTPKEVRSGSQATQFIFSEACYGANIENKSEDQSLAIKFMSAGCQVMVASTCISYGSVTTPLIGADLLGYNYWRNLKDGTPAGEALLQAKVALVNEMTKRQGLLDGEDQKTLISFVLFGDPLALMDESNVKAKNFIRSNQYPAFKVISDMIEVETDWHPVPANVLAQVKQAVDQYLPGLKDADFAVSQQVSAYNEEGHPLPGSQMGAKVKPGSAPARTVVRLKKQVTFAEHVHNQYGRVTVDSRGKVIKLSLSR
jgi:hypothetical protein